MQLPRLRRSFSLKTLLFVVTLTAIGVFLFRREQTAELRADITADLTSDGCTVLLGSQAPPGTAPPSANQDVVYIALGENVYTFQNVLKENLFWRAFGGNDRTRRDLDPSKADLTRLAYFTELRVLDVGSRPLTDEDLRYIGNLPRLEVLVGSDAQSVTDEGLRHLSRLTELRIVSLAHLAITDESLQALAGLTNLEALSLYGARITGSGLHHLRGLSKLRRLNLGNTQVDDSGLAHLRGHLSLEDLALHGTRITDEALPHLRSLPKLTNLDVARTSVSLEATESLRKGATTRMWITR